MSVHGAWMRVVLVLSLLALGLLACSLTSGAGNDGIDMQTVPLVLLLAPENNSTFAEGTSVEFYALAQDTEGRVARIEFRVDDVALADTVSTNDSDQVTVFGNVAWTAAGQSKHIVTVEAFRSDGLSLGLVDHVVTVVQTPLAGVVSGSPSVNLLAGPDSSTSVPTPTPADSASQADMGIFTGPTAVVIVAELNIRQGPDTGYPPVGTLKKGDRVQIMGRNGDSSWWAVAYSGGTAWVFAELVTLEGDASTVPLVASPQN